MSQPRTIEGREKTKFVESPTRENNSAIEVVIGGSSQPIKTIDNSPFGDFDEISASYPNTTTEIYTYKKQSATIGTVTVSYNDTAKSELSSVVYSVL
jgi:hypothetical protein